MGGNGHNIARGTAAPVLRPFSHWSGQFFKRPSPALSRFCNYSPTVRAASRPAAPKARPTHEPRRQNRPVCHRGGGDKSRCAASITIRRVRDAEVVAPGFKGWEITIGGSAGLPGHAGRILRHANRVLLGIRHTS